MKLNKQHINVKFTVEKEINNSISWILQYAERKQS
jgi:hypothetical protein